MALRFLFDECVATTLVDMAHARGFEAYHVARRGLAGAKAPRAPLAADRGGARAGHEQRARLHGAPHARRRTPGPHSLRDQVRPRLQALLFAAALDHVGAREDLINRVLEVDVDEATRRALAPNSRLLDEAWERLAVELRPTVRELEMPTE